MSDRTQGQLRVLIADGPDARLEEVAGTVASLGHAVIAQERNLDNVASLTAAEHPDVAIVIVGESEKALDLIAGIVREAACPVIAILEAQDRAFIKEAANQGIFAYILMERHSIDEEKAFKLLRDQARRSQRKIVDVAEAVLSSHTLLPSGPQPEHPAHEGARDQTRA